MDNGGGANTLTLTNCTVSGNSSGGGESGVMNDANLTMTNTIVSGNKYGDVLGSYSGGNNLVGGNALLAPLGNYGGPTQTSTLAGQPGHRRGGLRRRHPVIDQRGQPRAGLVDIGAFQSQGFTLTLASSSAFQSAPINTNFASPLAVTVTAINSVEPVNGGVVSFAVTPVGSASATLSAATSTITGAKASVTTTANGTIGQYLVTATAAGARPVGFVLTNTQPSSLGCQPPSRQPPSRQPPAAGPPARGRPVR